MSSRRYDASTTDCGRHRWHRFADSPMAFKLIAHCAGRRRPGHRTHRDGLHPCCSRV